MLISLVAVSAFLSMPYSTLMPVFAGKVLRKRRSRSWRSFTKAPFR